MSVDAARMYRLPHDPGNPYIAWIVGSVPAGSTVLDVGCANGRLAALLPPGCIVDGIEIDRALADSARHRLRTVWEGDIEDAATLGSVPDGAYDVVLLADVVEHLVNPLQALRRLRRKVRPSGFLVVGLPNFLYAKVRWQLLRGHFEYDASGGILDINHVRFYTPDSARRLFADAGLAESAFRAIGPQALALRRYLPAVVFARLSRALEWTAARRPGLFSPAMIFVLTPDSPPSDDV